MHFRHLSLLIGLPGGPQAGRASFHLARPPALHSQGRSVVKLDAQGKGSLAARTVGIARGCTLRWSPETAEFLCVMAPLATGVASLPGEAP